MRDMSYLALGAFCVVLLAYAASVWASDRLGTIASIAAGGVVTLAASWWFYQRASRELLDEAEKLRRMNHLIMYGLEQPGPVSYARDTGGEVIGMWQRAGVRGRFHLTVPGSDLPPDALWDFNPSGAENPERP
jgi:hypothetical protein